MKLTKKHYGKVSVIMASYNSAEFISESIDAIIDQTYQDWELIICDDCSTDDTQAVVAPYVANDERIRFFVNPANGGPGVTRNNAMRQATGRFVAFCDSDDVWKPEKLQKQLDFMDANKVAFSYHSYVECTEQGDELRVICAPKRQSYADIKRDDKMGFSTIVYDASVVGKVDMPTMRKRQDWGWKILAMERAQMAQGVVDVLGYYRLRSGSVSRNKLKLIKFNVRVYREVLHYSPIGAWLMFLFVFFPTYLKKKLIHRLEN